MPPTIYDTVPYRSGARTVTHPDHLAVLGRLLGMSNADPSGCRVLELGCGDGGNLIPMALSLPGSQFVGIDLASTAIERGRAAAAAVGLDNVQLLPGDITEVGAELGEFDYVIAHGVYSWVPPAVRAALLRVIRERMRPQGLAFVSYNAMPGDHIRGVVRQMMKMHTADIQDPRRKLEQARALLNMLARAPAEAGDVYRPLLQSEVGRALQSSDDLLFHDDLAEISQPFFFTEFMGAARAAGLQFAAEAQFHSMNIGVLPEDLAAPLRELAARDLVAKEQYLDFLTCRGFRQTVLCHEEVALRRDVDAERMAGFRFTCEAQRTEPAGDGDGTATFQHRNTSSVRTDHAPTIRALDYLVAANPLSVPFDELAAAARATSPEEREALADMLFQTFAVGVTELRLHDPAIVLEVTERPEASAWARHTAPQGRSVNLCHETIELDEPSQRLLPFADGTRSVEEIGAASGLDAQAVRTSLGELARLALLVG